MSVLTAIQPLYALSGLVIGFLVGMTGVGGGSLMTPLLILVFGVHPQAAVGTDLLYAAITKSVGTLAHGRRGVIDWLAVGTMAAGSVPATLLTLWWLHRLGSPSHDTSDIVRVALGVALLLTVPSVLFRPWLQKWSLGRGASIPPWMVRPLTIVLGACLGVMVTISSVGAGAIGVTALILLYPSFSTARIVGSDIAHAVPLTLIAGAGHWVMGDVRLPMLMSLLCGSIPGILLGSACVNAVSDRVQRGILATVLLIVGARMV